MPHGVSSDPTTTTTSHLSRPSRAFIRGGTGTSSSRGVGGRAASLSLSFIREAVTAGGDAGEDAGGAPSPDPARLPPHQPCFLLHLQIRPAAGVLWRVCGGSAPVVTGSGERQCRSGERWRLLMDGLCGLIHVFSFFLIFLFD